MPCQDPLGEPPRPAEHGRDDVGGGVVDGIGDLLAVRLARADHHRPHVADRGARQMAANLPLGVGIEVGDGGMLGIADDLGRALHDLVEPPGPARE